MTVVGWGNHAPIVQGGRVVFTGGSCSTDDLAGAWLRVGRWAKPKVEPKYFARNVDGRVWRVKGAAFARAVRREADEVAAKEAGRAAYGEAMLAAQARLLLGRLGRLR